MELARGTPRTSSLCCLCRLLLLRCLLYLLLSPLVVSVPVLSLEPCSHPLELQLVSLFLSYLVAPPPLPLPLPFQLPLTLLRRCLPNLSLDPLTQL